MTKIYNKLKERPKRKELRNKMPPAEVLLWSRLQKRGILGFKFRRQYGVGPYVLDFYCAEARLAVEIDGPSHFQENAPVDDENRQKVIEERGIRFLRFTNLEVYKNLNGVVEAIAGALGKSGGKSTPSGLRPRPP